MYIEVTLILIAIVIYYFANNLFLNSIINRNKDFEPESNSYSCITSILALYRCLFLVNLILFMTVFVLMDDGMAKSFTSFHIYFFAVLGVFIYTESHYILMTHLNHYYVTFDNNYIEYHLGPYFRRCQPIIIYYSEIEKIDKTNQYTFYMKDNRKSVIKIKHIELLKGSSHLKKQLDELVRSQRQIF